MFNIAFRFFNMITISKFTIISKSINFFKSNTLHHLFNMIKSSALKPGVSAIKPFSLSNSSTCLVVCLPRLSDLEISLVSRFSSGLNVFINVDFQHQIVHLTQLDHWAKYSQYQLYQFFTYKLNRISYFLICI